MAEPHFLDAARRSKAVVKEAARLQIRMDAPDCITFAPDQTKSHNSFKRIFHVPALPEPKEAMYNFEWDIAKHEGREYVPPSSFVIGDDEELTPAQKIVQETRKEAASSAVAQDQEAQTPSETTKKSDVVHQEDSTTRKSSTEDNPMAQNDDDPSIESDELNNKQHQTMESEEASRPNESMPADSKQPESGQKVQQDVSEPVSDTQNDQVASSNEEAPHDEPKAAALDDVTTDTKDSASKQDSSEKAQNSCAEARNENEGHDKTAEGTDAPAHQTAQNKEEDPQQDPAATPNATEQEEKEPKDVDIGLDHQDAEKNEKDTGEAMEPLTLEANAHAKPEPEESHGSHSMDLPREPNLEQDSAEKQDPDASVTSKATGPSNDEEERVADDAAVLEKPQAPKDDKEAEATITEDSHSGTMTAKNTETISEGPSQKIEPTPAQQDQENESAEASEPNPDLAKPGKAMDDHPSKDAQAKANKNDVNDTASIMTRASTMSHYAPSVSAFSVMAEQSLSGKLDNLPAIVQKNLQVKDYKVPPSISSKDDGKKPWSSSTWSSNRAFEMLHQQPPGRDSGTQWASVNGVGDTTSSVSQNVTLDIISALFVPDPRPWRPYRFVRRTNPRQVLVMCAGTALSPQQIRSAEIAHRVASGNMKKEEAAKSLASYYSTTENTDLQAGLGFIYSPDKAICQALQEELDVSRVEKNFARRLERPEFPATTTRHRAALRSVIAALEYIRWEEEGFDKIVLATHHGWIVRGIAYDIWEWRQNGWRFMRNNPLGLPGESVPDRDLWELLDYVVRQYESIDCNCRFWHIPKSANQQAIALAEMGALKTNQQPGTVRWTKTKRA
ncbi:hypothetical protein MNAN1_002421 [Malassezia nana]|uniref:RNase H type-1 domain-containing protein n=1 Tax=Malassezia nana TaxID=180528 RepID=A0AAF0EMX2_9BASI|nr:hypothetical protein MNAN1_002421 [Malassezia nana]